MAPIRRLPVLQNATAEGEEDRPAWHWVLIGILFIFSIWVPLAMVANWISGRILHRTFGEMPPAEIANHLATAPQSTQLAVWLSVTAGPALSFAASCWSAGALVGRFGAKAGVRQAAMAGALSAAIGALLSWGLTSRLSSVAGLALLLPLGTGAAWLGGRFGFARRVASIHRAPPPPGGGGGRTV